MPVLETCPACGRETFVCAGRCEWCGSSFLRTTGQGRNLVNRAARRNMAWVTVFYGLGSVSVLAGLWSYLSLILWDGIVPTPLPWKDITVSITIASIAFGVGYELHRRVKATTRCKRCRGKMTLVGVRDSNPCDPAEGYTEYTYRCDRCGHQRTFVDA